MDEKSSSDEFPFVEAELVLSIRFKKIRPINSRTQKERKIIATATLGVS